MVAKKDQDPEETGKRIMTPSLPNCLVLTFYLLADGLDDVARRFAAALQEARWPAVTGWAVPKTAAVTSRHLPLELPAGASLRLELGPGKTLDVDTPGDDSRLFESELSLRLHKHQAARLPMLAAASADLCRSLLNQESLDVALLHWLGGGAQCLPNAPLASSRSQLLVTTEADVAYFYDDPDIFWQGWDAIEAHGKRRLLLRALAATSGHEYLAAVRDQQWALARAAKAGQNEIYAPRVLPEEKKIFAAGEARLEGVGYLSDRKLVEYSCYVENDEHIQGWEIYQLKEIVDQRRLSDGREVETVRVVFFSQAMAEREKRPLLDFGVKVYYMDAAGNDVEMVE